MSELYLEGFTQNRELSWLKFNERVLNEANNIDNPILERLKFSMIYENNLTEFIKVRIGSLNNLKRVDSVTRDSMSGLTSGEQINYIWQEIRRINDKFEAIITQLYDDLQDIGVRCGQHKELSEYDYDFVDGQFLMKLSSDIKSYFWIVMIWQR